MTIECYDSTCKYHSNQLREDEGPFCFEDKCRKMTELEINKTIHKAMGKCWHEYVQQTSNGELWACCKAGCTKITGYSGRLTDYPSYTSSWADYGHMLEWAMKQEWWNKFAFDGNGRYEFRVNTLLNPLRGSTAITKFLKEIN